MNAKERNTHRADFTRSNRRFEDKFFPKIKKAIETKKSSLIDVIREKGIQQAYNSLSTDLTNVELSSTVRKMYLEVGAQYARKEYRRQRQEIRLVGFPKKRSNVLKAKLQSVPMETKGIGFNDQWIAFILQYLEQFLLEKITYTVNETTRQALLDVLQEAIAQGWGIDETVKKIEDLPFTTAQAARITRTEINRAANVGTMAGVDTSEYEMNKEWIAAMDNRTRGNPMTGQRDHANHWGLDGQVIGFEDTFKDPRNGDQLEFPGDPKASAASTVNCRCSVAPVGKRDANGFLVPKPQPTQVIPLGAMRQIPIAAQPFHFVLRGKA